MLWHCHDRYDYLHFCVLELLWGNCCANSNVVTWQGIPANLSVSPTGMSFDTIGGTAQVTATVSDQGGTLVPGAAVNFTVTGAGATSQTVNTNASGNAVFAFTSSVTGTSTVVASAQGASGLVSASTTVQWAGPPASIALGLARPFDQD